MTKERLVAILVRALVIALILLLVWEMVSITLAVRSINDNLNSIETMVAPDGPIEDSLDSMNRSLDSIENSLGLPTPTPTPDPRQSGR